ncbi:MAG: hydroxyphenylacetyl-CoA thioesterase PaaI [Nesterenkonia sp.]|uniref:hydroxyphenylacetyl-CoA thioesterase PaaI n=1 Tax=Nesterenkonia marinintestina TaxID=2979865 RepID=UPI0021BF401D|nr:hydroxyphenylacetyl-CoA thioesterase PaaI [Nesterenkonia sp. GX14115]MDO5492388.1 hydroxyphenylacetyl-CoA thioesterase PaaI [Nesterenkonia sp.]
MPQPLEAPTHAMLASDHASQWLGIEVLQADLGHARITMTVRREMTNGFAITHGGMVFSLADTAFAMSCNAPDGDADTVTVASGVDINFLRPAAVGDVLIAEARAVAATGRSGVCDVVVTRDSDDEPIALFRGRYRTIPAPSSPAGAETSREK